MGIKRIKHLWIVIPVLVLTFANIPQAETVLKTKNISNMGAVRIHAATAAVNNTSIRILGYRYNVTVNGYGVVYGIEPTINGEKVTEKGLIYGASFAGATESEMTVDNNSSLTYKVAATPKGEISEDYEISNTMKYYAVTMKENGDTKEAIDASYMVRAYAVLEGGSVVYSNIFRFSVYKICNSLYKNCHMENEEEHNWIYENILKVSDPDYEPVEYSWGSVIKP